MIISNHGPCSTKKCPNGAIFRVGPGDEGKVCKDHKPEGVVFAPFLGQQEKFFARKERLVFTGGAVAGGKSLMLLMKFMQQLNHERMRHEFMRKRGKRHQSRAFGGYFRRVTPDLEQIKMRSVEYFNAIDPEARMNEAKGHWRFPNCGGAVFKFCAMEHEKDKYKYKSTEFTYLAFDELTEFTETQFDYMDTRLRTGDEELEPFVQCCAASNPDGAGLLWVRKRFIEIAEPETVIRIENKLRDGRVIAFEQVFIPAKLTDNPIMMESGQYEAALMNKRPEVREALLEGNWYVIAGAFLSHIWHSSIHVCEDHDIPEGARVFRAMDWGMNAPGSCGWFYMDADGCLTMFAHLRFQGLVAAKVAEKMQAIEARWGFWDEEHMRSKLNFGRCPLDSSCFNTAATAGTPTIAKEFADNGFRFRPAKKKNGSRLAGARQIQRRLMTLIEAAYPLATSPTERERPMLRFMRSCKSPIETIPILQSDPDDPEDVDTKGDDHDWDMCISKDVRVITQEYGSVPIGDLVGKSGHVLSSDGRMHSFSDCRLTRRMAPTIEVVFDGGTRVKCTPDHRFMLEDKTWRRADELLGQRVMQWSEYQTPSNASEGSIIGYADITSSGTESASTVPCSKPSMGQCLPAMMSTTSTETVGTMSRATSARLNPPSTQGTTHWNLSQQGDLSQEEWTPRPAQGLWPSPPSGTSRTPEERLTRSSPRETGKPAQSSLPAENAMASSSATLGFAVQGARTVTMLALSEPRDVYCLSVPDTQAFCVEDGIVVHNCMYACLENPVALPTEDDLDEDDDMPEVAQRGARSGLTLGPPIK